MTAVLAAVLAAARRLPFWVWPLLALALLIGSAFFANHMRLLDQDFIAKFPGCCT